jgi:hypothetical protein
MSLKDDLLAGLKAIDHPSAARPLTLDARGSCVVSVPIPASVARLTEGKLQVQVQMSRTGRQFSLRTPLARFTAAPDRALLENLLHRQYYPEQTTGIGLAVSPADDVLVATYHWMLDAIATKDFVSLFTKFSTGVLDLLGEIATLGRNEPGVEPVHPKAG